MVAALRQGGGALQLVAANDFIAFDFFFFLPVVVVDGQAGVV